MKTILVPTDFSENAKECSYLCYYALATDLKAAKGYFV